MFASNVMHIPMLCCRILPGSVGDPPWFEKFVLECVASEKRSCEGLSLSICGVAMVETAQIWRRSGWELTRKLLTFYFAYVSLQGCGQLSAVTVKTFAAFEMNRLACRGSEGKSISVQGCMSHLFLSRPPSYSRPKGTKATKVERFRIYTRVKMLSVIDCNTSSN